MHTLIPATRMPRASHGIWMLFLLCLTAAVPAKAQISWNAVGGGYWGDPLNWYPNEVPDRPGEAAVISLAGSYTVYVEDRFWPDRVDLTNPQATLSILDWGLLSTGGAGILNHGTIQSLARRCGLAGTIVNHSDGAILVPSGTTLTFGGAVVSNDGTIRVNSDHGLDSAVFQMDDSDGMTLNGIGQLLLLGDGVPARAEIASIQGTTWTQGPSHSIRGDGTISAPFVNEGLVSANAPGSSILLSGNPKTNSGILEARDGAFLDVTAYVTQSAAGVIRADGGTVRILSGGRIWNGTLDTPNAGRITSEPGTIEVCVSTNEGVLDVLAGSRMITGLDLLTNNGTITLNPEQTGADAVIQGYPYHNVTFGGTGQIVMRTAGDVNDARMETTGETLINGPLHAIRGEGSITCPFVNHGLISADSPTRALRLAGSPKNNDGQIEARNQGELEISGTAVSQSGPGTVTADGGIVRLMDGGSIRNGVMASMNGGRFETTPGTCGIYDLTNAAEIDVAGGSRLIAGWSTVVNNGTIRLNPAQSADNAILACCDYCNVTFDGTGQIVMRTGGDLEDASIITYGWYMVNGPNHAIRGEGSIHVTTQNQGTLQADVSGRALFCDGQVTNTGWARATDGGRLEIPARFENQGIAEASEGGAARFGNIGANFWDGGLHGGKWRVHENSLMRLMGADIGTLDADLLLDGSNSNLYRDDGATDALASLAAISANGRLEIRNARNLATSGGLTNSGTLVVGAASVLTVPAVFTQEGDATHGLTTVDGVVSSPQTLQIHGGVLDGTGAIDGDLVSSGDVRPGHSAGTLTIQGDYEQTASGILTIELAGLGETQFDRLHAAGEAQLGGTLLVRAIDGFHPQVGDAFPILARSGGGGDFDAVVPDLGGDLAAIVEYTPTAVTVRIVSPSGIEEPEGPWDGPADDPSPNIPTALRLAARRIDATQSILVLDLPEASSARVSIYEANGRCVAVPLDHALPAGSHELRWRGIADDGRRLPSGVYFVRADVVGSRGVEVRGTRLLLLR